MSPSQCKAKDTAEDPLPQIIPLGTSSGAIRPIKRETETLEP
jgi:hypothetical protein